MGIVGRAGRTWLARADGLPGAFTLCPESFAMILGDPASPQ